MQTCIYRTIHHFLLLKPTMHEKNMIYSKPFLLTEEAKKKMKKMKDAVSSGGGGGEVVIGMLSTGPR